MSFLPPRGLDFPSNLPLDDTNLLASETALRRLTGDLVSGRLRPGAKLKLRELIERYDIGAHPLREALAQLIVRELVVFEGNKGFRAAPVSTEQLLDITRTRQIVEVAALELAMSHGTSAWEEDIVASLALLKLEIGRRVSSSDEWLDRYESRHHAFHRALIAACPLKALRAFCDDLYIRKTRYRRLLKEKGYSESVGIAQHEELMRLVLARDVTGATEALRAHIGLTLDALIDMLDKANY